MSLISDHPSQKRQSLVCNSVLTTVAQGRANDMINRDYVDHINPDGHGPNYLVAEAGYTLPHYYSITPTANSIESLVAATDGRTAEQALDYLLNSPAHRKHILGDSSFFHDQSEIGIGYASEPQSDYLHYWVVLIALPAP